MSRNAIACNLRRELSGRWIFYFFRCNPLKSPDLEKEIKGDKSFFPFISLHWLAINSRAG